MKKKICVLVLLVLFLQSCGEVEEDNTEVVKQDFLVKTNVFQNFGSDSIIKKSAKLTSSQDITVTSNAVGRVGKIYVKEGDRVFVGQALADLDDNIGSYGISVNRASNSVERAKINYDSTKLSLDKAIHDTELTLSQLEFNLQSLRQDKEETLKKSQLDLDNSDYSSIDSKSGLELEKIENTISKLQLDYDTKLLNDAETISSFNNTLKKEYNSVLILQDDVIELGDKLFGITSKYKDNVRKLKDYFGGRDSVEKSQTRAYLTQLIAFRNGSFGNLDIDTISDDEIIASIDILLGGFDVIKQFLNSLESSLNNSITSIGSFSETDVSTYLAMVNGFQSSSQLSYSALIGFSSSTKSFLRTYENSQQSLSQQIDLLKKDGEILLKGLSIGGVGAEVGYEKTVISYNDRIKNLETQVALTRNNLLNARKSREVTLRSLNNGINEARIGYSGAAKELSKLTIDSPISGTVGKVFIDEGQEIGVGVSAFSVSNISSPEIAFSFSKGELSSVAVGQNVYLKIGNRSFTGRLDSISDISDENLKYRASTSFEGNLPSLGDIVKVVIPIKAKQTLIPLNAIIKQSLAAKGSEDLGKVYFLEGDELKSMNVILGDIYFDKVEVLGCIVDGIDAECNDKKIILSDMSQYDKNKFKLIENEK